MNDDEIFSALKNFDDDYIPFPPFIRAAQAIEASLKLYRETGIARHLLVLGESGTGKSSLCRWISQQYPKYEMPDRDILPVLNVAVPPTATIAGVAESILRCLGDPSPLVGNISSKTFRIIQLSRACRIELCLFDEAQHIHDRGKTTTHYMVGDWVKNLIDEIGVPMVLIGLPRLEYLLQVNEQLRRRFSNRLRLALGQCETESIHSECLQLFHSLGACLPLSISPGEFGWEEMGMRLFYASDGRVAYIKKLLAGALQFGLEANIGTIDPNVLEQIFTNEIWWEGIDELNPFSPKFEFRRLDRGGEPFESGSFMFRKTKREPLC